MDDRSRFDERATERAKALVGQVVDERYKIDRILAMGGLGTVYLARHLKLKKRVALKVLHPDAEDHPELFLRFEREAMAGAQVNHPNVAAATDFGDLPDGTRYLVMEYVKGTTLRAVLDADAPLDPLRAARIARQIAVALAEIHERGIVHRDLKPRNVMLSESDIVKIVDFGFAKVSGARDSSMSIPEEDEGARLTAGGTIFGTIEYLAPEAALGMDFVDARSDLYALGVMLYEMLTGKHPFDAPNEVELFAKQRTEPAPRFEVRAPRVAAPEDLEELALKLLAKSAEDRYESAADLVVALDAAMPEARVLAEPLAPSSEVFSSMRPPKTMAALASEPPPPSSSPPPSLETSAPEAVSVRVTQARPKKKKKKPNPALREPLPEEPERKSSITTWAIAGVIAAVLLALYFASGSNPQSSAGSSATSAKPSATAATASAAHTTPTVSATITASAAEPTVAPSASATASASASAAPPAPVPLDPEQITQLSQELKDKKLDQAADRGKKLLEDHATLLEDKQAPAAIRKLLATLVQKGHDRTDEIFLAVGTKQKALGPDLLYKLLETNGRSALATKAQQTLGDPAVKAAASPALLAAFELRIAPCNEKVTLLDRAASEGDERAIVVLDIQARGCFKDARKVDAALETLRKRLEPPKKP